ncbi:four helix bundle protein [Catalinimonas alkaloidigena]|uniref:Four helix bundle protein n=1 Tax=Catalinimonas alkaloidigena TaxID=1075417 RepID=A0A1G9T5J7_9BACT|nr:four helix bundle protein [Catalinimonas alkaloidigena]SDM42961.1 four helix bundle protein [Catalinimonas alkaloidigena]
MVLIEKAIMQDFRKLMVWQKAHQLVLEVYRVSNRFPKEEVYGLTNQLRRASVSIPANIAEGCGKYSDKDIANYFQISLGSLHETEYYFLLCKELGYLTPEEHASLQAVLQAIKAMLIRLIQKVRQAS